MPNRRSVVQVRLSLKDWARVKAAAKRQRRTVSAWVRNLALDALDATAREPAERKRKAK